MSTESENWDKSYLSSLISEMPLAAIAVAAENDLLYDKFGIANADDHELARSIQVNGIQEPLTYRMTKCC